MPPTGPPRIGLLAAALLSVVVGLAAAALNTGVIGPFGSEYGGLRTAVAGAHVLVDAPGAGIAGSRALPQDVATLVKRAELTGRLVVTPPILDRIARAAAVPRGELSATARTTGNVPLAFTEPRSEQRAHDIAAARATYRLELQSRPEAPMLDVWAQAPNETTARRLVDAVVPAVRDELAALAAAERFTGEGPVRLRQLGVARGGPVASRARLQVGALTFLCAFGLTAFLLGAVRRLRSPGSRDRETANGEAPDPSDAWPRTARPLPWVLAAFMTMLWLLPFDQVQLRGALPIDLTLDRLVLPLVVAVWLAAMATGGRGAPRIRMTPVHWALAGFVLIAVLSIVLGARDLVHTLEWTMAVKKLPLLVTYTMVFVIVASTVRRSEVRSFLVFNLGLAMVCGVGIVAEYRLELNAFYDAAALLFPAGAFEVGQALPGAVDEIGRRLVRGPAEVGLEAVTMLALALPIALVGLMEPSSLRSRSLYALGVLVIVAATLATYRKSALIVPVAVLVTLAYFRRAQLLRLAPLGAVLLLVVSVLSPGAIGSTLSQFTRADRGTITTVSDRTVDYDAVRPDVWTAVALGRGWGSYDHRSYRILDSEILRRTIETGVIGLAAFLFLGVSVLLTVRGAIASRDPARAPPALVGAAGAVAFMVVATLYDVLAFPHAVYLFLTIAGLAVVVGGEPQPVRAASPTDTTSAETGRRSVAEPTAEIADDLVPAPA